MRRPLAQTPFVIIGAGGHASVVAAMLRALGAAIHGLTDRNPAVAGLLVIGAPVLGDDGVLDALGAGAVQLANGIGVQPKVGGLATPDAGTGARRRVFDELTAAAFAFPPLIHPSAVVAEAVEIGGGAQLMAGVVVQPRVTVGENAVINSSASIDHDCRIGAHAFIGPGAILCGGVEIGSGALIGAGALILPGIAIGEDAIVGAGVVVRRDVEGRQFACQPREARVPGKPPRGPPRHRT